MTPNAVARAVLGLAGVLFGAFGMIDLARTPALLVTPVEPAWANAVKVEIWTNVAAAVLSIVIGCALFGYRNRLATRLEPAREGDAFASIGLQSLVYALVGVYFLLPALAHILSYLTMNGYTSSGEWRAWSTQLFQAVLALTLILGARRFARSGSA